MAVFTITQLAHVFVHHPGPTAVVQIAVMFGPIWWMYGGYVWLTNEVAPSSSARRTWLLIGMFAFFVLALAVPNAFHGGGVAFGVGYALVTGVHTALFASAGGASASLAIRRIGPLNALSAGLVLAGGLVHGVAQYGLWAAAFALQIATPYLVDAGGFVVRASHFCERHGLVIIVALGESVVALGVGLAGEPITVGLIVMVALGLGLAYVLWWAYFGFDDERGEHALAAVPDSDRVRPALVAYDYAFYPLLVGVILTSAGIALSIAHGHESVGWPAALALSGGVALYFVGQAWFRATLKLPGARSRLIGAVVVAATAPLGVYTVAWIQLAALVGLAFAVVIADDKAILRAGEHSSYA
ncbi:low temperature requirement protein A [Nocardia camponoti]|uniref:Low temperature requirement protein A n=1 Tax=Nocardia camponoti TaxID=1616106 RepID=A0A917QTZ8_9NOCA|nr:low temperature requirement protein A [Nocardia camponoti]GGK67050.1 low temperature requirement protein A [Nocardia camponoti]